MKTSKKKTIPFEAKTTEEAMKKAVEHFGVAGEEDLAIEKTEEVKGFWGDAPEKVIIHVRPRVPEPQPGEMDAQWVKAVELTRSFLEDIFKAATLEVDVDVHPAAVPYLQIEITGTDSSYIIGHKGEVLQAIGTILTKAINRQIEIEDGIKFLVDSSGYRFQHDESLRELALHTKELVLQRRKPVTLQPMNPAERRIIHLALKDAPVQTRSIGEGRLKKIIISPK